jgi:hypothetical protein
MKLYYNNYEIIIIFSSYKPSTEILLDKISTYASGNKRHSWVTLQQPLPIITGIVYLDMLQQFLIPQLDQDDQSA